MSDTCSSSSSEESVTSSEVRYKTQLLEKSRDQLVAHAKRRKLSSYGTKGTLASRIAADKAKNGGEDTDNASPEVKKRGRAPLPQTVEVKNSAAQLWVLSQPTLQDAPPKTVPAEDTPEHIVFTNLVTRNPAIDRFFSVVSVETLSEPSRGLLRGTHVIWCSVCKSAIPPHTRRTKAAVVLVPEPGHQRCSVFV
eukprot:TRINITY_DN850_c1_g1_i2.p1 TRINITY_DN850_c1_g1~~TRINITY_DN850_c1_g1_i2.p1  ORF type:complete len:194 (-),score=26.79 TRINITY_DN850_c1_g1_i2:572-1153(-)